MLKKSKIFFSIISGLLSLLIIQTIYLSITKVPSREVVKEKIAFVTLIGLPDLAISTEAIYIRHRSLADIFSIYKDDGNLREYFPSTFVYSHSTILHNTPSNIIIDKEIN